MPEIRFKNYNSEWHIKQLSEIGTLKAGGTPSTFVQSFWNGNINWLQSGAVQNNVVYPNAVTKRISQEGLEHSSAYIIKEDSVLIAITGATCANVGYLTFPSAANQSVVAIKNGDETNSKFLFQNLLTQRAQILSFRGGSAQGGVSLSTLKKIKVLVPTLKEQNNIARLLSSLDLMIENLTAKIVSLNQFREASLCFMFPTSNQASPTLRFEGFSEPWKEVSMNDVFTERHEISTITKQLPQLSFTIAEGVIFPEDRKSNKRDFLIKDKDNKKYLVTRRGDIIYNPANVIYGAIHQNHLTDGVVLPIYKIFKTEQDPNFMEYLVRRPSFIKEMTIYMEGTVTKLKTLKPESFLKMKALIAPTLDEQKAIGSFLRSLDERISIESHRLEKLKRIKTACLDKMFV